MESEFKRLSGLAMSLVVALAVTSQTASAGEYRSEVEIPYTYSSGQTHKIFMPYDANAPDRIKIKSVSWSWGRHVNHQSYNVKLCQVIKDVCKDISHQKIGTTTDFNYADAAMPFYLLVTSVGRPFNPEWGLTGRMVVQW